MDFVRASPLQFVGSCLADHFGQQVNRDQATPQAGADLESDESPEVFKPRRHDGKIGYVQPPEQQAVPLGILVEQTRNGGPGENEHLIGRAR